MNRNQQGQSGLRRVEHTENEQRWLMREVCGWFALVTTLQ